MSEFPDLIERVQNSIKIMEDTGLDGPWHITFNPEYDVDAIDIVSDITFHYESTMPEGQVLIESEFGYLQRRRNGEV